MKHLFNFTIGILLLSVISVSFIQLPVKTISIVNRYCKLTHNKSSRAGHCFATGLYFFVLSLGSFYTFSHRKQNGQMNIVCIKAYIFERLFKVAIIANILNFLPF